MVGDEGVVWDPLQGLRIAAGRRPRRVTKIVDMMNIRQQLTVGMAVDSLTLHLTEAPPATPPETTTRIHEMIAQLTEIVPTGTLRGVVAGQSSEATALSTDETRGTGVVMGDQGPEVWRHADSTPIHKVAGVVEITGRDLLLMGRTQGQFDVAGTWMMASDGLWGRCLGAEETERTATVVMPNEGMALEVDHNMVGRPRLEVEGTSPALTTSSSKFASNGDSKSQNYMSVYLNGKGQLHLSWGCLWCCFCCLSDRRKSASRCQFCFL